MQNNKLLILFTKSLLFNFFYLHLTTQQYNCVMIPDFTTVHGALWPLLPPGIYDASLHEFVERFVYNDKRQVLYQGLLMGLTNLFQAGCRQAFIDGSYVTAKPVPGDYDLCWDIAGVNPNLIDPVFEDFSNKRENQKLKYGGEYFPFSFLEPPAHSFLTFFQTDKASGGQKGIIRITNFITEKGAAK